MNSSTPHAARVRVPNMSSTLLFFKVKFLLYCRMKRMKINKKRPGLANLKILCSHVYYPTMPLPWWYETNASSYFSSKRIDVLLLMCCCRAKTNNSLMDGNIFIIINSSSSKSNNNRWLLSKVKNKTRIKENGCIFFSKNGPLIDVRAASKTVRDISSRTRWMK